VTASEGSELATAPESDGRYLALDMQRWSGVAEYDRESLLPVRLVAEGGNA
jgi:hypothetical protein